MQPWVYERALANGADAEVFPPELRGQLALLLRRRVASLRRDVTDTEVALAHALERTFATRGLPAPAARAIALARELLTGVPADEEIP